MTINFTSTGKSLTMDAMRHIEVKAMTNASIPVDYATNAVHRAIIELIKSGITQPSRIPWN